MGERDEQRPPAESGGPSDVRHVLPSAEGDVTGDDAVTKDAEELRPDQINPLAPPVNTEAGA